MFRVPICGVRQSRTGVGTAVVAIMVVAIIAVAAGAYVMAIVSENPNSSSKAPASTTASSLSSSSASAVASSTQSSSAATSSSVSTEAAASSSSASKSSTSTYSTSHTYTYTTTYVTSYSTSYTTSFTLPVSSATTSTGTTCTSTSSTNTSSGAQLDNFSLTFAEYSEMAIRYNGTENGNTFDATYDYHVISTTSNSYLVNVTATEGPMVVHYTDDVLKNGTAAWVYYDGQNFTGASAYIFYFASMVPYLLGNVYGEAGLLGELTSSSLVHVAGTGTLTMGSTKANVTDYEANYLPLKETSCDESIYLTRFFLQVGNVTGESVLLLTAMNLTGTVNSGGVTDSVDLSLHVTSVTKTA